MTSMPEKNREGQIQEVIVAEPLLGAPSSVELVGESVLVNKDEDAPTPNEQAVTDSVERADGDEIPVVDMAARAKRARAIRKDAVLMDAVTVAREAALTIADEASLGEHAGVQMVGERLATHRFECLEEGYPGWFWEVTLARAPRSKKLTICEVQLVSGPDALLAPPWVPWRERLEPSDVSRADVLPYDANDERLQNGFEEVDSTEAELQGLEEMGHGRKRVLSQYGLDLAADRWYDSPRGPAPGAAPEAMCATCGFLMRMQGSVGTLFGVCANEWSPDDGSVVSFDHSCGAHSETDQPHQNSQWPIVPSRLNEEAVVLDRF